MATVNAATAGTAHGTLTINTPEVISFGTGGKVAVQNRGDTVMYGQLGVTDLTLAGQGTESIGPGETVTFYGDSSSAGTICLKSSAAVAYSISRFTLPRSGDGDSGAGAGGTPDTELPTAAALSDTTANPTAPMVGAALMYWDGTQWVRWQRFVKTLGVSSPTLANVSGSATSVTVFASNANARGRMVHNDSTAALYLKFGATASTTSYTVRLDADAYYEFPSPLYTGVVDGIWATAAGSARTTEVA
jgi:hypothetical protein